jgi:hypothetical protein
MHYTTDRTAQRHMPWPMPHTCTIAARGHVSRFRHMQGAASSAGFVTAAKRLHQRETGCRTRPSASIAVATSGAACANWSAYRCEGEQRGRCGKCCACSACVCRTHRCGRECLNGVRLGAAAGEDLAGVKHDGVAVGCIATWARARLFHAALAGGAEPVHLSAGPRVQDCMHVRVSSG